jgi:predicted neuraminidase
VNEGVKIGAIQPTLLLHPDDQVQAMGRTKQGRIFEIWSRDGGKTWGEMSLTELPNPNSGVDGVTLRDGRHVLVYNHSSNVPGTTKGLRAPLNIAISRDGKTWQAALVLEPLDEVLREKQPQYQFSYPAVIQTSDGLVHVTYTWHRRRIQHSVIDPAQLVLRDIAHGEWPK